MWMHGFLGFDASFMLDVVVVALVLIVPVQLWAIRLARTGRYPLHKRVQLTLAVVLLLAVGAFEVDLQLLHGGWENVVNKDADTPRLTGDELQIVRRVLWVHLIFAVSTPLLWGLTIALALKRIPVPPGPCRHSPLHRKLGWASAIDLLLTSLTGMAFYYVTFMT
jgi:putative membrane protein